VTHRRLHIGGTLRWARGRCRARRTLPEGVNVVDGADTERGGSAVAARMLGIDSRIAAGRINSEENHQRMRQIR